MKIERNFKRRAAPLVETRPPVIAYGKGYGLGILVGFMAREDGKTLHMHMTPAEALELGERLTRIGKQLGAVS